MSYVTICGRIGRDGETRDGGSEKVLNFSVAETIGYGDKQKTQWWSCALWGKRAESLQPYIVKGGAVTVIGNPELREYTGRDGTQKSELTCRVIDVVLQSKKQDSSERAAEPAAKPATPPQQAAAFDDDIPF